MANYRFFQNTNSTGYFVDTDFSPELQFYCNGVVKATELAIHLKTKEGKTVKIAFSDCDLANSIPAITATNGLDLAQTLSNDYFFSNGGGNGEGVAFDFQKDNEAFFGTKRYIVPQKVTTGPTTRPASRPNNQTIFLPFKIDKKTNFQAFGFRVRNRMSATECSVAIYQADPNNLPAVGTVVVQQTLSLPNTGNYSIPLNFILNEGLYYFAFKSDGFGVELSGFNEEYGRPVTHYGTVGSNRPRMRATLNTPYVAGFSNNPTGLNYADGAGFIPAQFTLQPA